MSKTIVSPASPEPSSARSHAAAAEANNVKKAAWAGLVGTMLENYDFVIYGTASALIFNRLFFPNISPSAGIIASFGAYAIGFLARPLGGLFFSHYGEKFGRKWVLVSTVFLMGTATFAIGCIPAYETIGVGAPLLLVLCRFLQGFGAGAEQAGGATLLTETAPSGRRGRLASLVMVGAALGAALGASAWTSVQSLFSPDALIAWGWRTLFWSSIVVTFAAYLIRLKLAESPIFIALKKKAAAAPRAPLTDVARHGTKSVLRVIFMSWGLMTQSYTYQVFLLAYVVTAVGIDSSFIPPVQLFASLIAAMAAFIAGRASDAFGRRPMTLALTGIMTLTPFIIFPALHTGSPVLVAAVVILGYASAYAIPGIHMSFFPELFGSRYRYAGVTLGREFSSIIGGGAAPVLCASLLAWFGNSWIPIAVYMSLTMLASVFATYSAPETADRDLSLPGDAQWGEARLKATRQ